jgi:hypothetical protein
LARLLGAVYLRIDSIEQAIRDSVTEKDLYDAGYRVGYAVAEDNLRLGRTVVADSVNPIALTRDSWLAVAKRGQVHAVEIEVQCSDVDDIDDGWKRAVPKFGGFDCPPGKKCCQANINRGTASTGYRRCTPDHRTKREDYSRIDPTPSVTPTSVKQPSP